MWPGVCRISPREPCDLDDAALVQAVVGRQDLGGGHAQPAGLDVHHLDQRKVARVVEDGGAGEALQARGAGDVVDVGVGDEDLLDGELVALQDGHDARDVIAGIDDDGFAGGLVTEDGAVALQRADGEDFVDHGASSAGGYFFGVVCWVGVPERTDLSPLERASITVSEMEITMKRTAP